MDWLENVIFINVQHAKQMYHFTLCAFVGLNYSNWIVMHRMENVKNLKESKTWNNLTFQEQQEGIFEW